jgi:hypothetical protein
LFPIKKGNQKQGLPVEVISSLSNKPFFFHKNKVRSVSAVSVSRENNARSGIAISVLRNTWALYPLIGLIDSWQKPHRHQTTNIKQSNYRSVLRNTWALYPLIGLIDSWQKPHPHQTTNIKQSNYRSVLRNTRALYPLIGLIITWLKPQRSQTTGTKQCSFFCAYPHRINEYAWRQPRPAF